MKTTIAIFMALASMAIVGCQATGNQGGGVAKDDGFKIGVPSMETGIKQGETQNVIVSVQRGDFFKQDVKLAIKPTPGINVDPTSIKVNASDKPDVQVRISANKDAALGDYRVYVTATPTTGEPSSADFNVKVVAP